MRNINFNLSLVILLTIISCQQSQPLVEEPVQKHIVQPNFSFRAHIETDFVAGHPDSLILSQKGRNNVLILDKDIQLSDNDLNKIEYKKKSADTKSITLYFNKEGTRKITQLVKSKKNKKLIFMLNGEVYDVIDISKLPTKGTLELKSHIMSTDADKLYETMPERLRVK